MVDRKELILKKIEEFKDFIVQKQDDLTGCFCDIDGGFRFFRMYQADELLSGDRLRMYVTFNFISSTKNQEDIANYIQQFSNYFREELMEGRIEITKFLITFNIDLYVLLEMNYERVEADEKN